MSFDFLIMQGVNIGGELNLNIVDPGTNLSFFVTGKQKVVQKYLMALLTQRGTDKTDTTYGTDFISRVGISNIHNGQILQNEFNKASSEAVSWVQSNESGITDTNEKLVSATLESFNTTGTAVRFDVRIDVESGAQIDYSFEVATPALTETI